MFRSLLFFSLLFVLNACVYTHFTGSKTTYYKTENFSGSDSLIEADIRPYRGKLESEMNKVIGISEYNLKKEQPESNLGNWAADAVAEQMEIYTGKKIDFALLNYGGLRISSIAAGEITKGKIYELMPFDNMLVMLEMKGAELDTLFKHMIAKGGWPVSAAVKIKGDKNGNIKIISINGNPIDAEKIYNIATIDYLANGGDNCSFFIGKKQLSTGIFLRDAVIANIEKKQAAGQQSGAQKSGRFIIE